MNRNGDTLTHTGSNRKLIETLADYNVDFILIGGLAVSWYCSERQADDMDLLIKDTSENSMKLSRALSALGIMGFDNDSFVKPALQVPLKSVFYADLLTTKLSGPSYDEIHEKSIGAKLFGIRIKVASIDTLILMKQQVIARSKQDCVKHEQDIQSLKKLI